MSETDEERWERLHDMIEAAIKEQIGGEAIYDESGKPVCHITDVATRVADALFKPSEPS